MMMDARMAKAKLAPYCAVNTVVWVRKPGPMAEVAMMKAAPRRTDQLVLDPGLLITGSANEYSPYLLLINCLRQFDSSLQAVQLRPAVMEHVDAAADIIHDSQVETAI